MELENKSIAQRVLSLIGPAHLAVLATVTEEGKPWARYVIPRTSEDMTIRVAVRLNSRKVKQIKQNQEVHLTCGVSDPRQIDSYLQIQGQARVSQSSKERKNFWDPHLEQVFNGPDDPNFGVIIIKPYRIELWEEDTPHPQIWTA